MAETKICPHCGKEILAVAKKCKYCKEWIDPASVAPTAPIVPQEEKETSVKEQSVKTNTPKVSKNFVGAIAILAVLLIVFIAYKGCDGKVSGGNRVSEAAYDEVDYSSVCDTDAVTCPDESMIETSGYAALSDFSGEWEDAQSNLGLQLTLKHNTTNNSVNVNLCGVYRSDFWEPSGRIENNKLILDDAQGTFHAEFELNGDELSGKCKAIGAFGTYDGGLIMKRVDTDNALYKLNHSGGGTYQFVTNKEEIIDGRTVQITSGIDVCLRNGPQMAIIKLYDDYYNEDEEQYGEYSIDKYNITIDFGDGGSKVIGSFSEDMSTLHLDNYLVNKPITLHRVGDFNW